MSCATTTNLEQVAIESLLNQVEFDAVKIGSRWRLQQMRCSLLSTKKDRKNDFIIENMTINGSRGEIENALRCRGSCPHPMLN